MNYELISYTAGITASLVMIVVMLSALSDFDGKNWRYGLLIQLLAVSSILDVVMQSVSFSCIADGVDTDFLGYFILPVVSICEIGLVIFGVFWIVRGSPHALKLLIHLSEAFFALVALYPCTYRLYMPQDKLFWDVNNYIAFTSTTVSTCLTAMVYLVGISFLLLATKEVVYGYKRYRELLYMYFSDDLSRTRQKCFTWFVCCLLFTVFSIANTVATIPIFHIVARFFIILFYLAVCLLLLENHKLIERIEVAFVNIKRRNVYFSSEDVPVVGEPVESTTLSISEIKNTKAKIEKWYAREDKPFLHIGITLQDLANDINVPVQVLLKHGYFIYGTSFREWIMLLRTGNKGRNRQPLEGQREQVP